MSTVKLKRLKINQYRNVRPGTELHFDDGVNLVLGQNGSGKTTLLGLLSMVCGWYFAELEYEEFDIEFDFAGDTERIRCTLSNRRTSTSAEEGSLAYDFQLFYGDTAFQARATPRALTFSGPGFTTHSDPHPPFKHDFSLHILQPRNRADGSQRSSHIDQFITIAANCFIGTPYRFDEGLGCFYALTGESAPASSPAGLTLASTDFTLDLTKHPTQVVSFGNQNSIATSLGVVLQVFAGAGPDWTPFDTVAGDKVAFLTEAIAQLGFAGATLRLAEATASGPPARRKIQMSGFDFMFTRRDGTSIPHRILSYGQKRLLAFYYYLACNKTFVIADELVNGLHHRWIDACMKALGERQAFLTSQNPLLFDYVEFDSIEQVQARFITCKSELVDGVEELVWQNMPREDAARFYEAYTDEIEQVGEILITRGLW